MSWEDQGRQEHGWFGNGTAPPKDATGEGASNKRSGPDGAYSADVAAARAYAWAKIYGPVLLGFPRGEAALEEFAEEASRIERARPGSLARALDARVARALGSDMLVRASAEPSGNGAATQADEEHVPQLSGGGGYLPFREGYHRYQAGPNVVCSAALRCSAEEMKNQMSRFAVPGRSPDHPVLSGQRYPVYDPITGLFVGNVTTTVSPNGLTIRNKTVPGHLLHDGQITRTATRNPDGSWSITTVGVGNNIWPGLATANELAGPRIFDSLDEQMRQDIERHHGAH